MGVPTPSVFNKVVAYRYRDNMGPREHKSYTVAASNTINYLDIVSLTSSTVQQAISLPGSNNTGTASGGNLPCLGIALGSIVMPASGGELVTGRTSIPVAVWEDSLELLLRIYNASAASTQAADLTIGTAYQFQRWRGASASSWWNSLITTTTNGELRYVEPYAGNSGTDNYEMVWLRAIAGDTVRQG